MTSTVAIIDYGSGNLRSAAKAFERSVRALRSEIEVNVTSDPDAVRKAVLEYTKIPPKAAESMTLPQWQADLNEPTIEQTAELAKKYGFVEQAPPMDELILQQG